MVGVITTTWAVRNLRRDRLTFDRPDDHYSDCRMKGYAAAAVEEHAMRGDVVMKLGTGSSEARGGTFSAPKVVEKPWGRELWWAETDAYLGKVLEVRAGHSLSLQYHRQKLETLFFSGGTGRLTLGDTEHDIRPGTAVTVPPGVKHRITALTDLTILEVSTAHPDDVVRLEDAYGREDKA